MRLNTEFFKWGLRRTISGRSKDISEVASTCWEICPPETFKIPPAIYLTGTMDRVVGLSPWRNWDTERILIEGGTVNHAASQAYLLRNANLSGAFLYCGAAKAKPGFGSRQLLQKETGTVHRFESVHLMSSWAGSAYFGNFMQDVFPLQLLPSNADHCISLATKTYIHELGYRDVFSLPPPQRVVAASVESLTLYKDYAQNSSKAKRYRILRQRLRKTLTKNSDAIAQGVYLKRGSTGERRILTNEKQLEAVLSAVGFDIVEPAKLPSLDIAQRLLDAPVVIGVEGSHLAHAIYPIADNGTLLVIQPPNRFAMPYKEFTDRLEMNFAFLVGHEDEHGFSVDIDEVERMLELIL